MLNVQRVAVHFKDGPKPFVLDDVVIEETLTTLTIHQSDFKFSVVPLSNLSHYDVELS